MVLGEHAPVVLLTEDEPLLRELLAMYLYRAGYSVAVAGEGREALQLFGQVRESVRLIVTDVDMPLVSGIELAAAVEDSGAGCQLLLISGSPMPPEVWNRGWEFLAKPFTRAAFLQTVERLLALAPPGSGAARPRVLLAEDDREIRRRLCRILSGEYDIVAAVEEGGAVLEKAEELRPHVILLDIAMPGMNGFAVARVLRHAMPEVPLLFVTQYSDPAYVAEAFASGGAGYVLKRNIVTELGSAVEQVRSGGRYLSPGLHAA
jgi:CheY-like chemotaxis protein